jgi:hypothetical protein
MLPRPSVDNLHRLAVAADSLAETVPDHALCRGCNYPLKNLPTNICPECGRAFDPRNRATMNLGRPISGFARWILSPVGWPTYLLAAGLCLFCLYLAASPGILWANGRYVVPVNACIVFSFVHLGHFLIRSCVVRHYRQPHEPHLDTTRWGWLWISILLTGLAVAMILPLRARVWLSFSELNQLVEDARAPREAEDFTTPTGRQFVDIGPFTVMPSRSYPISSGYAFRLDDMSSMDYLIYSPDARPDNATRLWGHWYIIFDPY